MLRERYQFQSSAFSQEETLRSLKEQRKRETVKNFNIDNIHQRLNSYASFENGQCYTLSH